MSDAPSPSRNRSSLLFVAGLALAATVALAYDSWGRAAFLAGQTVIDVGEAPRYVPQAPRDLTPAEQAAVGMAWSYIAANTQPSTGLVNSVDGYPSTTLWDQGSYLLGMIAANRFQLIDDAEFYDRAARAVESLAQIPLVDGILPNKVYQTQTLEMVDYANNPVPEGLGWSALDLGRFMMALRVLERALPELGPQIRNVLAQWELDAMAHQGQLAGAARQGGGLVPVQEGRIGYEQYAARAAAMWGVDVTAAISAGRILAWEQVSGVEVPTDLRTRAAFGAIDPVVSEPWMLQGLEIGLDSEGQELAARVYRAQERRWRQTGHLTAVSEDHINQAPHFLYAGVWGDGEAWSVLTEEGKNHPELRTLSTKASFAWHALYNTRYTERLMEAVLPLSAPGKGFAAGTFEADGTLNDVYTLNTNGIVLEALHYIAFGPLWQVR